MQYPNPAELLMLGTYLLQIFDAATKASGDGASRITRSARPSGRCFKAIILLALITATSSILSLKYEIWCIREDSNLRPLGS